MLTDGVAATSSVFPSLKALGHLGRKPELRQLHDRTQLGICFLALPASVGLFVLAPQMCHTVASRAMQAFGGMGVSQDTPIHGIFTASRYCQIADGPDEVHLSQLGKLTMRGR